MALISVVIPYCNRAEMLCACVDSVLVGEGAELEVMRDWTDGFTPSA